MNVEYPRRASRNHVRHGVDASGDTLDRQFATFETPHALCMQEAERVGGNEDQGTPLCFSNCLPPFMVADQATQYGPKYKLFNIQQPSNYIVFITSRCHWVLQHVSARKAAALLSIRGMRRLASR